MCKLVHIHEGNCAPDDVKVGRVHPVAHDITGGPDRRRAGVRHGVDVGTVPQQNLDCEVA